MCHPSFVGRGIVAGVGAEFEPDKISLDAVVVVKKGVRHQGHELLQFLLVFLIILA
jgi:hypothetical protein